MAFTEEDLERIDEIIARGERRIARFRARVEANRALGSTIQISEETLTALLETQAIAIEQRRLMLRNMQRKAT